MSALLIAAHDVVLSIARALLPVREATSQNTGRFVEAIQQITGTEPPAPWCASFIAYVGKHALGKHWPLPLTASCDELLKAAQRHQVIIPEPKRGAVFLVLKTPADAVHAGFVLTAALTADTKAFATVEGNASATGSVNGDGVHSLARGASNDPRKYVFVDWERLIPGKRP